MANEKLLLETLEYIKTHPQFWEQSAWGIWTNEVTGHPEIILTTVAMEEINSCGSAFCFAGHAALRTGFPPPPKSPNEMWTDDKGTWIDDHARTALGLTYDQADILFSPENTMDELETLVKAIIENPEIDADELEKLVDRYESDYCCEECDGNGDDDVY